MHTILWTLDHAPANTTLDVRIFERCAVVRGVAGWLTTLVTCRAAGEREGGVYECRDVDGLARDSVTVNVARRTDHGRGLTASLVYAFKAGRKSKRN